MPLACSWSWIRWFHISYKAKSNSRTPSFCNWSAAAEAEGPAESFHFKDTTARYSRSPLSRLSERWASALMQILCQHQIRTKHLKATGSFKLSCSEKKIENRTNALRFFFLTSFELYSKQKTRKIPKALGHIYRNISHDGDQWKTRSGNRQKQQEIEKNRVRAGTHFSWGVFLIKTLSTMTHG